jgi:NADH-quinone oxidoreductase subunit E
VSGHEFQSFFPESGSIDYTDTASSITDETIAEMRQIAARYPEPRSALLPMLHLVQSVDGRISPAGHRGLRRGAGHLDRAGGGRGHVLHDVRP